jgi:hypothetical protein
LGATRYGAAVDVPVGLRIIAKFLKDRIQHDCLRADARLCVEGEPPPRPYPDFRADAKAEGDEVVLGGWLSKDGCPASKALWFSVRISRSAFPWIWARGEPSRSIAALELLATLFCVILFSGHLKASQCVVTGLTDNKGNAHVLQRFMTTKFPLSAVLMELAMWLPSIAEVHGLSLLWVPRLQNEEADALTNEDFSGFDPKLRIHVDPSAVKWRVLPEMSKYGSDLQARVAEAKEKLKSSQSQLSTKGVKRKAGSSLRETDPW